MNSRILVIEDDNQMRWSIAHSLQQQLENLSIYEVNTFEEMIQILEVTEFDVIITGLYYFGDISGRAFKTILHSLKGKNTPVIFLSSIVEPKDVFEAAKLGGFDFLFLDMNFNSKSLVDSVKSALALRNIPKVFVSYSSVDRSFARKLSKSLHSRGLRVWYDEWEIIVGDSITQKIEEGIISSSFLVIILSTASVSSPWVREELDAALMRQITDRKVQVLPVLKEACEIPPLLRSKKYADFTKKYKLGLDNLVQSINTKQRVIRESK
ncbi:MAG: hypothetical protein AUG51_12520 [Acidobacteria bacterium 13_1_20CM_3_53_8]|nr:MAG: hypothetical protein AUG51_12520 [Acidobacteria bacterium 13_1_20CM_3_53_8]